MTTKKAEFMLYMSEYGLPGDYLYTFRRAGVGFRSTVDMVKGSE